MNHPFAILFLVYCILGIVWAQYSTRFYLKRIPALCRAPSVKLLIIIALETILWPFALAGHFYMRRKFGIRA